MHHSSPSELDDGIVNGPSSSPLLIAIDTWKLLKLGSLSRGITTLILSVSANEESEIIVFSSLPLLWKRIRREKNPAMRTGSVPLTLTWSSCSNSSTWKLLAMRESKREDKGRGYKPQSFYLLYICPYTTLLSLYVHTFTTTEHYNKGHWGSSLRGCTKADYKEGFSTVNEATLLKEPNHHQHKI